MLYLKKIVKTYDTAGSKVDALKGISVGFRNNEFVAVLGPSGCGKTTLLNIIGGLDRYSSGDLIINKRSTKEFRDSDWDAYRNHSIGFVFQSYNLIPHQSVLSNVELALTLSGVGKAERRKRAAEALRKVGLGDQLNKKPGQMSGGQMQRVAIARALVNNPDILLADEPTGALDTETSVQIMDILREVAKDRLVIMVTHNPELAEQYATRIVRLLDGHIVSDSAPVTDGELAADTRDDTKKSKKQKHPSMSFKTALSLSFNNLLTKKARTFLTSFAGSIGIIGIALILAMSNGFQAYIDRVEADTLSTYPIALQAQSVDMSSLISSMTGKDNSGDLEVGGDGDKVYSVDTAGELYSTLQSQVKSNDIKAFYQYMNENMDTIKPLTNAIQYQYNVSMNLYNVNSPYGNIRVNPSSVGDSIENSYSGLSMFMNSASWDVFTEMMDNQELLSSQYDVVAGKWATSYDEVVLVIGKNNSVNILTLYTLGLLDQSELVEKLEAVAEGKPYEKDNVSYSFDEIVYDDHGTPDSSDDTGWSFRLVLESDYYKKNGDGVWQDMRGDASYVEGVASEGVEIKVVGIVRPSADAVAGAISSGSIAYTPALTKYIIDATERSEIVKEQKSSPDTDVFTGKPFASGYDTSSADAQRFKEYVAKLSVAERAAIMREIGKSSLTEEEKQAIIVNRTQSMTEEELTSMCMAKLGAMDSSEQMQLYGKYADALSKMNNPSVSQEELYKAMLPMIIELCGDDLVSGDALSDEDESARLDAYIESTSDDELVSHFKKYCLSKSTQEANLSALSSVDYESPIAINIYPADFDSKEKLSAIISEYNASREDGEQISYTDYIALFISSISTIIDTISYVLIGFVSVSLVVSSIMIGVITYISVLERTKEIGILRSIGASKHDIRMVFNAETFIVGLVSGLIGIGVTLLLTIPVNLIIGALSGIYNMALLPAAGAVILILISVVLTVIAGLFPAGMAAKRDPVVALRSE